MLLNVEDIRKHFRALLQCDKFVIDKSGCLVLELVGVSFLADEDFIFGKPNKQYIITELDWYQSQKRNIHAMVGPIPKIWEDISGVGGRIQSNYGWCIWSEENGLQYECVKAELTRHPSSRRAIMLYNRPSMHECFNSYGMDDFICTTSVQYFIRDSKYLDCVVNMRSNDVYYGYRNDCAWQVHVLGELAKDLDMFPRQIIWQAGSLHLYEKHFDYARE